VSGWLGVWLALCQPATLRLSTAAPLTVVGQHHLQHSFHVFRLPPHPSPPATPRLRSSHAAAAGPYGAYNKGGSETGMLSGMGATGQMGLAPGAQPDVQIRLVQVGICRWSPDAGLGCGYHSTRLELCGCAQQGSCEHCTPHLPAP
jgi:hypothetical protein